MAIDRWTGAIQVGDGARWERGDRLPRRSGGGAEPGQQVRAEQARVPGATLRVQDLEIRPAARGPVAVAGDGRRAPLPDNVPSEPDPARPGKLQAEPARLLDRGRQAPAEPVRLQHDEQRARAPGERREPAQPIPHAPAAERRVPAVRQVHDQQVHGPCREQRTRQRQRLVQHGRREHDQPRRLHAPRDGLDGIERPGEIEPGDDRPRRLRLRGDPQRDGGLAR
jgi:hypothetical protein